MQMKVRRPGSPTAPSTSRQEPTAPPLPRRRPAAPLQIQRVIRHDASPDTLGRDARSRSTTRSPVSDVIGHGGGRPLEEELRRAMETRLGEVFDTVRLHVDARSTESVGAQAYTVGEEIVVHPEFANLRSTDGRRLLAHELAHVIQQRRGSVAGNLASGGIKVSDPADRFEQAADAMARQTTLDHVPAIATDSAAPTVRSAPPPSTPATDLARSPTAPGLRPDVTVQRRKWIPRDKEVQVWDGNKVLLGKVEKTEDANGYYAIRVGDRDTGDIRTVHERFVELRAEDSGPQDWKGEQTLGALMMQTGSLNELVGAETDLTWEKVANKLAQNFKGFPAELATAYYVWDAARVSRRMGRRRVHIEFADKGKARPGLVVDVVAFLEKFMEANGQWPYIERQPWFTNKEYAIGIDINYYSDRRETEAPLTDPLEGFGNLGFHKDTAGDNVFVSLIFDNEQPIAGTEWFPDVEPEGEAVRTHQAALQPPEYRTELEALREANRAMFGRKSEVQGGVTKGAHSYVSWVDDALWHATPYPYARERLSAADVIQWYDNLETLSTLPEVQTPGSDAYEGRVEHLDELLKAIDPGFVSMTTDAIKALLDAAVRQRTKWHDACERMAARQATAEYDAEGHARRYANWEAANDRCDRLERAVKLARNRDLVPWRPYWNFWITTLATLGESKKTQLHAWLVGHKYSVRDVESWALEAWRDLYTSEPSYPGKKSVFEADVNARIRAGHDWPVSHGASEAIAYDPRMGNRSMKQAPPKVSRRPRRNSVNAKEVQEAIRAYGDNPRRFIRTWVRMVKLDSQSEELERVKQHVTIGAPVMKRVKGRQELMTGGSK